MHRALRLATAALLLAGCTDRGNEPTALVANVPRAWVQDSVPYVRVRLGHLGYAASWANDINDRNQAVGHAGSTNQGQYPHHAFLWENGVMRDLGTLGGGWSEALDINNAGQIVGWAGDSTQRRHAVLWDDAGGMTSLAEPGEVSSRADRINENGDILGSASLVAGEVQTVLWTGGQRLVLPLNASDLNNSSQVVGSIVVDGKKHAALWSSGTLTDLGTLGADESWATRINNSGDIIGVLKLLSGDLRAFLWRGGVMTDLGLYEDMTQSTPSAVNDAGQIAVRGYGIGESHALLWDGGVFTNTGNIGLELTTPYAMNDSGYVAGVGYQGPNYGWIYSRAFVWDGVRIYNLGQPGQTLPSYAVKVNTKGDVLGNEIDRSGADYYVATMWTRTPPPPPPLVPPLPPLPPLPLPPNP